MRIFASPSRYIQGENALFENAKSILDLGNRPILLCDQLVYDIVGKRFEDYLHRYGFHIVLTLFNGEASDAAGAHAVTAGADVFESAFAMPSIQKAVDDFSDDWFVIQNSRSI